MRHAHEWRPSKFELVDRRVAPSRDTTELANSSRLMASYIADFYNKAAPAYGSGRLLDLGCGKQPLYGLYKGVTESVIAVDWPTSTHANPHLDLYCDLNGDLPFRPDSFDTVLCSDVLEHVSRPDHVFREIHRVLRPGGVLLLNTPFLYAVHEAPHDYLRHTRYSLDVLATRAGLECIEVKALGGAIDVLADICAKILTQIPLFGGVLANALQWIAIVTKDSRVLRLARSRSAEHFPLAHGLVARKPYRC